MSIFASLAGVRIVSGSIAIPLFGLWSADVSLATPDAIPTDVPLVVGNLTLTGHVFRTATFGGQRMCRVVAGFGGWRKQVEARPYGSNPRLSLVLGDVANEVGERVNVPSDRVLGPKWTREAAAASRALRQTSGNDWHVDEKGVTQIAPWATKAVPSAFTVESHDAAGGKVTIATEDYASWLPGSTFKSPFLDGTYTVGASLFRLQDDGNVRLEILT